MSLARRWACTTPPSAFRIHLLALATLLSPACTSTDPPPPPPAPAATLTPTPTPAPDLAHAATLGACASLTQRVLRGLVGAAADRGIEDLTVVEADLAAYLDERCITEHWADSVVPAMLACKRGDNDCSRDALAPVMKHRPDFDEIIERHRKRKRP